MYYVYLIKNEIDEIYIGCTNDLERRFVEHNSNKTFSTKNHSWKLIYYESYISKDDAFNRKKMLKHHGYGIRHLKSRLKNSLSKV